MPKTTQTRAKSARAPATLAPTPARVQRSAPNRPTRGRPAVQSATKEKGNGKTTAPKALSAMTRPVPPAPAEPATPRGTKKATITALLQRPNGAGMAELVSVTGWLEHSVRAALTGLRQDGHEISRSKDASGATRYRIAAAA